MGRDYYFSRPQWPQDRLAANEHAYDGSSTPINVNGSTVGNAGNGSNGNTNTTTRYHEQNSDLSRPMSIERALRDHCRIPAQCYFVSAILDSGETVTFSGPTEYKDKVPSFFDTNQWMRCATGQSPSADLLDDADAAYEDHYGNGRSSRTRQTPSQSQAGSGQVLDYDGYESRRYDRRRVTGTDEWDEDAYRDRKRARAAGSSRRTGELMGSEERHVRVSQPTRVPIRISDEQMIWNIYDQRFRGLQQTACKLIAKAWVKLVEPKKQSTHPYTGSDEKAPEWWPKPWGTTRDEKVRHKEPDHLYKKERVHLLKHILRMIVLPNAEQHADIQKLNLTVAKLEEVTNEVLSSFFANKDAPNNAKKRPYLREIFHLAKNEERYRNGEIDGTTNVYVMSEDKLPDNYLSDNEGNSPIKDDDEPDTLRGPYTISPRRPAAQAMMPAVVRTAATDHAAASNLSPGAAPGSSHTFMGGLPHRSQPSYAPTHTNTHLMHADMGQEHGGGGGYVDGSAGLDDSSLPLQQMVPGAHAHAHAHAHDTGRRGSLFGGAAEFGGTSAAAVQAVAASAGVYPAWQPASNAPNTSSMYAAYPAVPTATAPGPGPGAGHSAGGGPGPGGSGAGPQTPQHGSFVPQPNNAVAMSTPGHAYMSHAFDSSLPRSAYDSTPHDAMFRPGHVPQPGAAAAVAAAGVNPSGGYSIPLPPQHDARSLSGHGMKVEPTSRGLLH